MPKHFNSVSRVCTILQKATSLGTNVPVAAGTGGFGGGGISTTKAIDAWAMVFGIPGESLPERNLQVGVMLGVLYNEIELAHQKTSNTTFSPDLYESAYHNAKACINIETLSQAWDAQIRSLTAETIRSLMFCAEALPNEEQPIAPEDLASLSQQVEQLRSLVNDGKLPEDVKSFLLNQIRIIEEAIRRYPIQGNKAFGNGIVETAAEIALHQDIVEQHSQSEEFSSLGRVWKFIRERNTDVEIILKVIMVGQAAAAFAGHLLGS